MSTTQNTPWRDAATLKRLYHGQGMSSLEIAERLGCTGSTVRKWLRRHDIETRSRGQQRVERASFSTTTDGHELWISQHNGKSTSVGVHQLLAIADGADPHNVFDNDTHVHHRSAVPWLNISGMVEVIDRGEHAQTHAAEEWESDDGIPVLVSEVENGGDESPY